MSISDLPTLDTDTDIDLMWFQCNAPCVSCSKVQFNKN